MIGRPRYRPDCFGRNLAAAVVLVLIFAKPISQALTLFDTASRVVQTSKSADLLTPNNLANDLALQPRASPQPATPPAPVGRCQPRNSHRDVLRAAVGQFCWAVFDKRADPAAGSARARTAPYGLPCAVTDLKFGLNRGIQRRGQRAGQNMKGHRGCFNAANVAVVYGRTSAIAADDVRARSNRRNNEAALRQRPGFGTHRHGNA